MCHTALAWHHARLACERDRRLLGYTKCPSHPPAPRPSHPQIFLPTLLCPAHRRSPFPTSQALGANALLLHILIDSVGAAARCAGPAFSRGSSKLLRASLLPLLERLADPCPLVASAAAGALASVCRHTGYPGGLHELVAANADYVVEGVCKQLRRLPQHPRAPQLLAALLRQAGVSAALMPLLAEPLRAALSVSGGFR